MLNISIVLYNPDWSQVNSLCEEIVQAQCVKTVYLLDNSKAESQDFPIDNPKVHYIFNNQNLGYGRAHNIAIRDSIYDNIDFHLVMNADILVKAEDIDQLHYFMLHNPQVGLVMPKVIYPDGSIQHLCKLLPTPLDVFGRRFLPEKWMQRRNERYELRASGYDKMMNVPYLSGCFMFLRTEAVLKARLFDERYFMYPEDIDLTRTIHRDYLTIFLPDITIVHNHARQSYHSLRLLLIHIVNMCRYFNKWGWFVDNERRIMNSLTLTSVGM